MHTATRIDINQETKRSRSVFNRFVTSVLCDDVNDDGKNGEAGVAGGQRRYTMVPDIDAFSNTDT
jgi:hypothetical protein